MLGQPSFFAIGPAEISGNTVSVNTGNLGSASQRYTNLFLTGTGSADTFSSRQLLGTTGQITGLSVSNLYPVGQPNLGHPTQKWTNSYLTGTGYAYSQEVIYNGQSEEVITRAEVTGRFVAKYLLSDHPVRFATGLVTGTTVSLGANKTYRLEYRLQYSGSSNTEGLRFSISGSNPYIFLAGNGIIDDFNDTPEAFSVSGYEYHSHFHGSQDRKPITVNLLFVNSNATNSVSVYAGKETSGVAEVCICSGSWLTATEYN